MHPVQRRIFKEMSPERKLEVAEMLYCSARELKAAPARDSHKGTKPRRVLLWSVIE